MIVFRPQNCGAVSQMFRATGRMLTIARVPRFYNKFCLQTDRSTTNAERAADRKIGGSALVPPRIKLRDRREAGQGRSFDADCTIPAAISGDTLLARLAHSTLMRA